MCKNPFSGETKRGRDFERILMEGLKKKLNFRICRSMGDVEEKADTTKPKTKPTHTPKYEQDNHQGNKKGKMRMKMKTKRKKVSPVPAGFFPVYVGPNENEKQRFVVKAEMANHPLFGILLDEAESKYGVHRQGPISLPCDVDLFYKVLVEMDMELENSKNNKSLDFKDDDTEHAAHASPLSSWNFIRGNRLSKLLVAVDDNRNSYSLLHQSELLKLNHY